MKNNIYTGLFCMGIAFSGVLSSCDVMDTKPFESYSEDLVWGSYETAEAFVIQTYNNTIANFSRNSAAWEVLTPNGAYCDQVGNSINTVATETGIDAYSDYGFGRFGEQRSCNMILEKVASSNLSEEQKKQLIAEGHFLRGVLYFDMTRKMGRFVPITRVLSVDDTEAFQTPLTESVNKSYEP